MVADFFKWAGVVNFSMIFIVLSALSYMHMVFSLIITLLIFGGVYIKSLVNEHPFLNFDVSNIDIDVNGEYQSVSDSSAENVYLHENRKQID